MREKKNNQTNRQTNKQNEQRQLAAPRRGVAVYLFTSSSSSFSACFSCSRAEGNEPIRFPVFLGLSGVIGGSWRAPSHQQ